MRILIVAASSSLLVTGGLLLASDSAAGEAACCATAKTVMFESPTTKPAAPTPVDGKDAFAELSKALIGTWTMDTKAGEKADGEMQFKLTAAGHVIHETMFAGMPHEMVNTYALDGNDLLVTHYCAGGNQPRMKLVSAVDGVYTFAFKDATNLASPDSPYMGGLTLTVTDGRIVESWTHYAKGVASGGVEIALVKK